MALLGVLISNSKCVSEITLYDDLHNTLITHLHIITPGTYPFRVAPHCTRQTKSDILCCGYLANANTNICKKALMTTKMHITTLDFCEIANRFVSLSLPFVQRRLLYALHLGSHTHAHSFTLLKKRRRKNKRKHVRLMVKLNEWTETETHNINNRTFFQLNSQLICVSGSQSDTWLETIPCRCFFFFFFLFSIQIFFQKSQRSVVAFFHSFTVITFLTLLRVVCREWGGRWRTIPLCSFVIRRNDNSINKQWVCVTRLKCTQAKTLFALFLLSLSVLGRFVYHSIEIGFFSHNTLTQLVPIRFRFDRNDLVFLIIFFG